MGFHGEGNAGEVVEGVGGGRWHRPPGRMDEIRAVPDLYQRRGVVKCPGEPPIVFRPIEQHGDFPAQQDLEGFPDWGRATEDPEGGFGQEPGEVA